LARLDESIAAFNQRFIFPLPFAMKIIKINLWNQGMLLVAWTKKQLAIPKLMSGLGTSVKKCPN
jgi:hypothetical protein